VKKVIAADREEQEFYYSSIRGRLLGGTAREEKIKKLMKENPGKSFLEVGCCEGYYVKKALESFPFAAGADLEFSKLFLARGKTGSENFAGANAESLPFRAKSFDFVLCTETLEHVPDWKKALSELRRVAGKKILLTVPLEHGYFWKAFSLFYGMDTRGHLHKLDREKIEGEMKGWKLADFELVCTPSRRANKKIKNRAGEKGSMYAVLFFEKKGKK